MKCPYAVNRVIKTVTSFEYNAESIETKQETNEINKAVYCECLKEDCGAYNKDTQRCEYAVMR